MTLSFKLPIAQGSPELALAHAGDRGSLTLTSNSHWALFPASSVAMQLMLVLPTVKILLPLGGSHVTVTVPELPLASTPKVTFSTEVNVGVDAATLTTLHVKVRGLEVFEGAVGEFDDVAVDAVDRSCGILHSRRSRCGGAAISPIILAAAL